MRVNRFFLVIAFFVIQSCSQPNELTDNLKKSRDFLESNLFNENIVEVEPGLQYQIIRSGDIATNHPALTDVITAHFHGTLIDGKVFWSSIELGEPLTIELSKLIPGCKKVIPLMRVGDIWRVYIDPDLAYGKEGRPTIPPNSALVFEIELIAINS